MAATLSIIVAMDENGVIGKNGKIPWHLSADLKRFKSLTMGHPIIMGRKTYESIGEPLPGRTNIVVSRNRSFFADGCVARHSFEEAVELAESTGIGKIFAVGGEEIYRTALPVAQEIYLTLVKASFEGDVFFPELNPERWFLANSELHSKDEKNPHDYEFLIYERLSERR